MMSNEDIISYVLEHVGIVDVVSQFVSLKPAGNDFVGTCPFHSGPGEFMVVSPQRQMFYCPKCNSRGGVVDFLMRMLHLTYNESVAWLGLHFQLDEFDYRQVLEEKECNFSVFEANRAAEQYFQNALRETDEGQNVGMSYYVERRQFSDDIIRAFGLGYDIDAPANGFFQSLEPGRFSDELLIRSFLTYSKNHVGPFHGRVVFPVYNVAGDVIAFSARTLRRKDETGDGTYRKYVNTGYPEVSEGFAPSVYIKGDNLFGLYQAKKSITETGFCVLVEGNADVVSLHCHGITNSVASLGTALTANQVQLLRRFTNRVVLMYDGDKAGKAATQKAIKLLIAGGMHVETVLLPDGEDPDSFSQGKTYDELVAYFANHTEDIVEYIVQANKERMDEDDEEFYQVLQDIELIIAMVDDIAWRNELAERCAAEAQKIGISAQEVLTAISTFARQRIQKQSIQHIEQEEPQPSKAIVAGELPAALRPLTTQEANLLSVMMWNFGVPIFTNGDDEVNVFEFLLDNLEKFEVAMKQIVGELDEEHQQIEADIAKMEADDTMEVSEVAKETNTLRARQQAISQLKAVYESCLFNDSSCFGTVLDVVKLRCQMGENVVVHLVNHKEKKVRDIIYSLCTTDEVVSRFFTKNRTLPENVSEDFRQRLIEKEMQRKADSNNSDLQQQTTTVLFEFIKSLYDAQLQMLTKLMKKYPLKTSPELRRLIQQHYKSVTDNRLQLVQSIQ